MPTSTPMFHVGSNTFLDNLRRSRLLSEEQIGQVARLAEEVAADELPAALVGDGILTPLQAHCVASGDVRSLVLGPYHLLEEVGRGGMGRVYKALHTVMGRVVALKLMSPETAQNDQSRQRFLREVRSVTKLSHPNIVLAHDANEIDEVLFLVMEYVEGTTLAELVRASGALPFDRACELMRQAAFGMQHAYENGLVHRDIKPANLLIPRAAASTGALIKIADFGLARWIGGDTVAGHTAVGFLGTPDYVAPEQCQDGRAADIRSDLYSLGCTFHYALTGRVPFGGDSVREKLFAHLMTPPPSVESLRSDVPPGVAAVVARLMAKNPDERFQTPGQLAQALAPWCADGGFNPILVRCEAEDHGPPLTRVVESGQAGQARPDTGKKAAVPTSSATWNTLPEPTDAPLPPTSLLPDVASSATAPAPPDAGQPVLPVPSALQDDSPSGSVFGSFRHAWLSWTAAIDDLARRPDVLPCSELAYQKLYHSLLKECEALAAQASEEDRGRLAHLQELVRPWMSLGVLSRTEPLLVQDLARQARLAGDALGLESESRGGIVWLVVLTMLAAVAPQALHAAGGLAQLRSLSSVPGGAWGIGLIAALIVLLAAWLFSRRRA